MCKLLIELFIQGGKIHPHFGLPTFVTTVQLGGSLAGKHRMIELWNRAEEYALISKLASSDAIKTTHLRMAGMDRQLATEAATLSQYSTINETV
jgi:hypothetical protein